MRLGRNIYIYLLIILIACNPKSELRNEVIIRLSQDPESLSAINYKNAAASQILNLLYQSLLVVDLKTKEFKPLLVKELPQVLKYPKKTGYLFRLKNDIFWQEKHPISIDDVLLTVKLIKCPLIDNEKLRASYEFIQDIEVDKSKNEFTFLSENYMPDEAYQLGDFFILPEHIIDPKGLLREFSVTDLKENYDSLSQHPKIIEFAQWFNNDRFTRDKNFLKGSGGYELTDWKTGQYLKLQKKKDWWGNKISPAQSYITANPEQIIFLVIPDNATALLALKSEQLDVYPGLPVTAYTQLAADKDFTQKYNLYTPETYDFTYIGINGRLPKFADAQTRQALACLFNVPQLIKTTQSGFAIATVGPIIPTDKELYNQDIKPYTFDFNKASSLLKQAGWVPKNNGWYKNINGKQEPLTINLNYKTGNTEFENIALIFQQAAANINIPVKVQPMEGGLLSENLKAHQYEMFIRYMSGNQFVYNFKSVLHTESAAEGGANYTGFGTTESDALIDRINETQDIKTKAALLKRFQEILHEQSNLIFLYFSTDRLAVHKRFTNLKVSGIKPGYDVSAFSLSGK